ncbi:MAG: gamma-glutamylcyclotransferase [Planctomycetes bacterium]|nr:gamma-glutamylcyclotransferase [Planctomycetota bacterium]
MSEPVCAVFVYGTLMRGGSREGLWPRRPQRIERGKAQGVLYDLGPYPAMVEGDGQVGGELWEFAPADMAETLDRLDQIEGYVPGDPNSLYVRRIIRCQTESRATALAFCYFFAKLEALTGAHLVPPGPDGVARWKPLG